MCDTKEHSISDYFERTPSSGPAFPHSPRMRVEKIFDQDILIRDIKWRRSTSENPYRNKFGEPRFVIFEFSFGRSLTRFNTHTGAKEVCSRLEHIQERNGLPVRGTVIYRDDGSYGLV